MIQLLSCLPGNKTADFNTGLIQDLSLVLNLRNTDVTPGPGVWSCYPWMGPRTRLTGRVWVDFTCRACQPLLPVADTDNEHLFSWLIYSPPFMDILIFSAQLCPVSSFNNPQTKYLSPILLYKPDAFNNNDMHGIHTVYPHYWSEGMKSSILWNGQGRITFRFGCFNLHKTDLIYIWPVSDQYCSIGERLISAKVWRKW